MLILKRLAMFLWSLVSLVAVAVLLLSLVGPWANQIVDWLNSSRTAAVVLYAFVAILVMGLLVVLVRSLVTRKPRHVVVTNMEDGAIVVTRDAIASQVSHVVAATPGLVARDVFVNIRRKGTVDVRARIEPAQSVNVMVVGPEVHDALVDELKLLCGDHLDKVCVEFMRAKDPSLAHTSTAETATEAALSPETTSEITIPVGQDVQDMPETAADTELADAAPNAQDQASSQA